MRGDLGQIDGGFPKDIQKIILRDEKPYTERPNAHMEPIDFDKEFPEFLKQFGNDFSMRDFLSYKLYPKVFEEFIAHKQKYGSVSVLPTPAFFYGLKPNEEIIVTLGQGKNTVIKYLNITEPDELGQRLVFFQLNGQMRSIPVRDNNIHTEHIIHPKATGEKQLGAPLQGSLSRILVHVGDEVNINTPLFTIEAMKMESTITSTFAGIVKRIHLSEKTLVEQDDLIIEFE